MKNNNKGFSLVELIVVIAIMAVLVGVLAPSLLRYVEKSRIQKDVSAVSEVREAVIIAMADEDIFEENKTGATIEIGDNTAITGGGTKLNAELATVIGATGVDFTSKGMSGTTVKLTLSVSGTSVTCVFDATNSTVSDATAKDALAKIK